MFSGIIEQTGKVKSIRKKGRQANITVQLQSEITDFNLGESVAVNGVCLTVVNHGNGFFSADVSEETLSRTNLGALKSSDVVNLERALKLGERLGGHLVSGHIDGVGRIAKKIKKGKDLLLTINTTDKITRYIVEKGSIAIDGISLTVASCDSKCFSVSIIPHTETFTNIREKKVGDTVNLENDVVGKYIEKHMYHESQKNGKKSKTISKEFLQKYGFM